MGTDLALRLQGQEEATSQEKMLLRANGFPSINLFSDSY